MNALQPTRRSWTRLLVQLAFGSWLIPLAASAQGPTPWAPAAVPGPTSAGGPVTTGPASQAVSMPSTPDESAAEAIASLRRHLGPGDTVSVLRTQGDSLSGRVVRVGEADLEIRTEDRQPDGTKNRLTLTIPLDAIQSLDRPRDSSRNGLLIGAGVGAGFGIAMFAHAAAIDANEMDEWAAGYVLGAIITTGVGALVGWAIDTVHSKPDFRYQRATGSGPRVRLVPVGAGGKGLALAVSF